MEEIPRSGREGLGKFTQKARERPEDGSRIAGEAPELSPKSPAEEAKPRSVVFTPLRCLQTCRVQQASKPVLRRYARRTPSLGLRSPSLGIHAKNGEVTAGIHAGRHLAEDDGKAPTTETTGASTGESEPRP